MAKKTTKTDIKKAKSLSNRLSTLDANYLLGKVPRKTYVKKRSSLKKEFTQFKRKVKK